MTNIPTELLRTFVAVADMRSFTRAAQSLGVTQPAVSAQIKRLQQLLAGDLMDKRVPGVSLTRNGETVLAHARRLLAINDQILNLAGATAAAHAIRLGLPGDFVGAGLWRTLAAFRDRRPDARFHVKAGASESLIGEVGQGELDVALAMSGADPCLDARFHWSEDMVWVRAPLTKVDPAAPVPLVSRGEASLIHRHVAGALERAGVAHTIAFTGASLASLASAVGAGLGVMALPRCVLDAEDEALVIWDDGPLPPLPAIMCNICVRAGANDLVHALAQALADAFGAGRALPRRAERAAGMMSAAGGR